VTQMDRYQPAQVRSDACSWRSAGVMSYNAETVTEGYTASYNPGRRTGWMASCDVRAGISRETSATIEQ
jgi:hypothetical protein